MVSTDSNQAVLDYVSIRDGKLSRGGTVLAQYESPDLGSLYQQLGFRYPKFFKMDGLSKLAWLAAEVLLIEPAGSARYEGLEKSRIALMLATTDGCLDVDHRFKASMDEIPSPALFVYTLPNIMLGEICIRHGFTGEQLCLTMDDFDAEEILAQLQDLVQHRGITHCLFGKVDAAAGRQEAILFWADAPAILKLNSTALNSLITESNAPNA
jgi:hypothetical protein